MTTPLKPKTLDEHRIYLYDTVKLMLWFIHHWLKKHPEESFQSVLRNRVDIYRKTDVNNGNINPKTLHWEYPEWLEMEQQAERIYKENLNDEPSFEEKAFQVFKPSIDARCQRDSNDNSEASRYQCGCFRHELALDPGTKTLHFHIANFCTPYSFFDYPAYTKGCFQMLIDRAEHIYGADTIATGSWLNSMQRWRDWFPQEWTDTLGEPNKEVRWHYGFWGQFITARKTFNYKYGKYLRETGEFPFYPRQAHCRISAMREKLDSITC